MSRKSARELALRLLYAADMNAVTPEEVLKDLNADNFTSLRPEDSLYEKLPIESERVYIEALLRGVAAHRNELDAFIDRYTIGWPLGRISRVTVSILRLCMFEILYMDDTDVPDAASINEAVDLARSYDSEEASKFINGILGSFVRAEKKKA
ncbi:MAG: transcription antitermination factor NusB [Clostridiaceae bacterium]|nr:transcription antitermination factor NusB [Clostridiaceae bacterium]